MKTLKNITLKVVVHEVSLIILNFFFNSVKKKLHFTVNNIVNRNSYDDFDDCKTMIDLGDNFCKTSTMKLPYEQIINIEFIILLTKTLLFNNFN